MKWQGHTRGGYLIRIYAEDGGGSWPIHGAAYMSHSGWYICLWTADGRNRDNAAFDLIPAPAGTPAERATT